VAQRANLIEANLSRANLSRANLSGANLSWADLSWANLSGANLIEANLSGADLTRANLSGADLTRANLSGANLSWADLTRAYLSGAYLSGANLSRAKIAGVKCPAPTMVLLAHWGEVSPDLCRDLMRFDAANCPNGRKRFAAWAAGGLCPYNGADVQRCANFTEHRGHYTLGPAQSALKLMRRVLAEKCDSTPAEKEPTT